MPAQEGPSRAVAPPVVTVVVPIRNEAEGIDLVLGDLLAQQPPEGGFEVLVVDGLSSDGTRERGETLAARDPRVRLLDNPRRLSSAARRLGTREARGEYVLFVDGHCRVRSRTLLVDLVALFRRTNADCLARPQPLVPRGDGILERAIAAARTSPFGHSTSSEIFGTK